MKPGRFAVVDSIYAWACLPGFNGLQILELVLPDCKSGRAVMRLVVKSTSEKHLRYWGNAKGLKGTSGKHLRYWVILYH